jgi:hypothetical protein
MRATSFRRLAGGAAGLMLAGATFLSATGAALAAVPTADAASSPIPAAYSAGNAAGFRGTFHYTDGSTLAKLYLNLTTTGANANVYFSATKNGANVANSCTVGALTTTCVFKTIRTNDTFVVTSAYSTSAATVTANFEWSSTGSTSSDGGTSHGDTWDDSIQTASLSNNPDYAGGFSASNGSTIGNSQTITATNKQATKLVNLPIGVAATVQDGSSTGPVCVTTPSVDCSTQFGEWSNVDVGDGQSFGSAFQIVITYATGTPKGFVHIFGSSQEFVPACPKKSPGSATPCFTWNNQTNQATIYTLHNGSWKGL